MIDFEKNSVFKWEPLAVQAVRSAIHDWRRIPGRHVVLLLGLWLLGGCAASHRSPEHPDTFIPDRSAEVTIGQMDRAAVRGVLGTPQLSSEYWGFDLFRADTSQSETVFAVTPLPVPFAHIKDLLQRYTLVAYGPDGRVSAVASGLFRRPAPWRNVSPIESDFPSLHLRAGELLFFVDPEGAREANLLVSPRSRDAFLQQARSSSSCTVVLACSNQGCGDQFAVDAGRVRRLPVRTAHTWWLGKSKRDAWLHGVEPHGIDADTWRQGMHGSGGDSGMPWLEALVAIRLVAGEHTLGLSAKHFSGATFETFTCVPGEVIYLVINATSNSSFWKHALVDWQINRSGTMPERIARRALILMDDGQWYVDPEPGE